MKPWTEITHYAGFDWAKDHHDVIIVNHTGRIVADFRIEHTAAGWEHWRQQVDTFAQGLAACVETSQGVVVEQLLASEVAVYPVCPASAKRYRERKVPSGNKTDRLDAWSLADALRVDGQGWKALAPEDPLVAELRLLCRDEITLITERTALINQLQSALHEYYPAALEAFEQWTLPSAWAFVEAFPTPQALQAAGRRRWEKFLHTHKLARPETYQQRLEIFARADQFVFYPALTSAKSRMAVTRARMLRLLQSQLDAYRAERSRKFSLPNIPIIISLVLCLVPARNWRRGCSGRSVRIGRALPIPAASSAWLERPRSAISPVKSTRCSCGATATSPCGTPCTCGLTSAGIAALGPRFTMTRSENAARATPARCVASASAG